MANWYWWFGTLSVQRAKQGQTTMNISLNRWGSTTGKEQLIHLRSNQMKLWLVTLCLAFPLALIFNCSGLNFHHKISLPACLQVSSKNDLWPSLVLSSFLTSSLCLLSIIKPLWRNLEGFATLKTLLNIKQLFSGRLWSNGMMCFYHLHLIRCKILWGILTRI